MTPWLILLVVIRAHGLAPIVETQEPLEDEYIVKLETDLHFLGFHVELEVVSEELKKQTDGEFGRYEWVRTLTGDQSVIIMRLDQMMLQKVRESILVEYVEEDSLQGFGIDDEVTSVEGRKKIPKNWGLDRINQVSENLDKDVSFNGTYGAGVHIYVIDSGVLDTHEDFEGRASRDFDVFGEDGDDLCGHGTSVAGIAASKMLGVAKKARIHSVRTLDVNCTARIRQMTQAIKWVTENAEFPCVATLSFSVPKKYRSICDAVKKLAQKGCIPVAAACNSRGNSSDSCDRSPAKCPDAITVAGTHYSDDFLADKSRFGICVDIFAPGEEVGTTAADGKLHYVTGTSVAVPYVAGVAAIHLGNGVPPEQVRSRIMDDASMCKVQRAGRGSPNRLLYIEPAQQTDVEN